MCVIALYICCYYFLLAWALCGRGRGQTSPDCNCYYGKDVEYDVSNPSKQRKISLASKTSIMSEKDEEMLLSFIERVG